MASPSFFQPLVRDSSLNSIDTLASALALSGLVGILALVTNELSIVRNECPVCTPAVTTCPTPRNPCAGVTCLNGGSCLVDLASTTEKCSCPVGFTGIRCETIVDSCTYNPCSNGGACSVGGSGQAICTCANGFAGPTCQVDCSAAVTCSSGLQKVSYSGRDHCYLISTNTIESWAAAAKFCSDMGLVLWEPNTNEEVTAVAAILGSHDYWVGASDTTTEGTTLMNSSGQPFTLTADGNTSLKDCVEYRKAMTKFEYRACTTSNRRFVCEQQSDC